MIFDTGEVGASGVDVGDIGHSLQFRASAYLSRTPGSAGNRKTFTWSGWVKRGKLGAPQSLLDGYQYTIAGDYLRFNPSDNLEFQYQPGAWGTSAAVATSSVFRDPSAHLHILLLVDTTQATSSSRVRIFVNNVEQTTSGTYPALNFDLLAINTTKQHLIGATGSSGGPVNFFDGYISRVAFVDDQALTPSSFGYLNTDINEWVTKSQAAVKAVVDAGGTNSFMLDFDNGSSLTTLGYDKSSKGNNWTLNNFSLTAGATYDWMLDVPGNSYATLNPLYTGKSTLSNGNLTASGSTDLPTISPDSSYGITWYFEIGGVAKTWTPPAAFPAASGDYNFGQRPWQSTGPTGAQRALCQANMPDNGTVTLSGSFTGNATADGPFVFINGVPKMLTINGNAVTFGTHADKLANGFKVRTASSTYNTAGSNTWMVTIDSNAQNLFKWNNAQGNP